jgi:hypothetical protein
MARWGSLGLALQVEGYQRAPTSCNDSLGPALQVEGMREPLTSQNDSLGVVVLEEVVVVAAALAIVVQGRSFLGTFKT